METDTQLWEILVPCLRNNRPVSVKHHREWDKYVRNLSGGLTIYRPAKGQWVDSATNELYDERVIPVRIACTEKQIVQIIKFTIRHYNQLAVMAYLVSNRVLIIHAEEL